MSDLGAIFHVKKNGTQYDAHAYTTLAECPYPNLKIKTKSGTQAYVKLTTNGQGDVPFRVKPKSESTTYQVIASAVPTGSAFFQQKNESISPSTFTVPQAVTRLKIVAKAYNGDTTTSYVNVSAQKTYEFYYSYVSGEHWDKGQAFFAGIRIFYGFNTGLNNITIYWSPAINAGTE